MRKIVLSLLSLLFALSVSHAQIWLEAGPKASFGPSGYFNSAIASDSNHDYSLNLAYNFGLSVGLNIGDYHGINIEGAWGSYYQDFLYYGGSESTRNTLEWEVFDTYATYRFYPDSGMFLELGAKFTQINEISQREGVRPVDIQGKYEDDYISGVLGVGAILSGSRFMVIKSGLRFEYGLTDFVSPEGVADGFPSNKSGLADPGNTVPYRVSFGIEVTFPLGGVAQASCGRRSFMLGGSYR